jgi:ankyrin repeat protein
MFYRLPDLLENQPEIYEKDKGSAGIHGQQFEYKFCALLFARAIKRGYKFKLASNMKGLGAFDDVVIEYLDDTSRKRHIFVQLKSKENTLIKMSHLKPMKGDFSLRKYYESYVETEKKFNCCEGAKTDGSIDDSLFVIYTNADVAEELKSDKVTEVGDEVFLNTDGSVLQFNEEQHKDIYECLQELPKHREFLSRFRIFYSQADVKKMDTHIRHELDKITKLKESEIDWANMCFVHYMKDWWQNKNFFLTDTICKENDPLRRALEEVRTTLAEEVLNQRKSELDQLGVTYKESAITDMKELIQPHKALLMFAPGRSTTLTAAKIHQMLSDTQHIILKLQQLVCYKSEVMLAWKNKFDVLVLESQSKVENFYDVVNEISVILNDCGSDKKFIFISDREGNIQQISALRQHFSNKLAEEYDDWNFTDILSESRMSFLGNNVVFQGSEIQIKFIVKESDGRMLNALDYDSMSLLLGNEKPSIGKPTENTVEYYIDRTLRSTRYTNADIQNESEVLVPFTNDSLDELTGISACRGENCTTSDNKQRISHLSLANTNEQSSKKHCCETSNLQCSCTKYEKCDSRHNIDDFGNAHLNLERKDTTVWRPSTLLDSENRIILIIDEAGMGKSTLLSHLAKETQKRHPDVWIVRVNINNYTSLLHKIQTNGFDEKDARKLLTEAAQIKNTDVLHLEKQLFNYVYNSTGNMVVLIDGLDEVSPHYTEEVIQILKILSTTKIRKIWVTFRNSVKSHLQQEFKCQTYSLKPFCVEDQKWFLVKFWHHNYPLVNTDYLENLANRVVELSLQHLTVREKTFMGVPLQSMLLAEVFEENIKQCSTARKIHLPQNINIVKIYDFYVKKKWSVYLSEKKLSDRTNVNVLSDDEALYDIFIDNHKAAALMAILSTHHFEKLKDKNVLQKGTNFLQKISEGLEKTGIITDVMEGRPLFQHRTFAEYFVATWLCDNIQGSQIFMGDHIFEAGFGVVRSMVDRILADRCPLHEAVLNSNMRYVAKLYQRKEAITQKDRGGRTPLHLAVSCKSAELTKFLLQHGANVSCVDTLLGLSSVQYAIRIGDWEILSLIMEKRPEIREQVLSAMNQDCDASCLRAAAKYGHTDLLRYLLTLDNSVNMTLPRDDGTLLHEAVQGKHIQTVRTLVDLGASCETKDVNGRTALHVAADTGSLEVAKFIVERQETSYGETDLKYIVTLDRVITKLNRLNVHDNDANTPLHSAAGAGHTSMVDYLLSAGSNLTSCNTRGEYPLTLAARYGRNDTVKLLLQRNREMKSEEIMTGALTAAILGGHVDTAELLLRSGAPLSRGENENPIHTASRMGHTNIVSLLLHHGASLKSRTDSGNTALHMASEAGHMSVVKYLVERQGEDMDCLNSGKETPMHLAARNGREYLIKVFIENGANINVTSGNGDTCLHLACENGHYKTMLYLLGRGATVNAVNSAHKTPLHIAASQGHTQIVQLLLLHNADVSLRDKDGFTALLAACKNAHLDTVRFIVQHGGNIQDTDSEGNTIAHIAVANENIDILKFLSIRDANLDVQNSDGNTPLLQAVREGKTRIVQYLAERNTDINTQGSDGLRPLDVAFLKGNLEITQLLLELNALSGKTGMHVVVAARFGFLDLLQRFVAMGEEINVKTEEGESPLHAACKSDQVATVQYLCQYGALLESQDNSGNTPLHVAVSNGYFDVTRVLVENGANMSVSNASGSTALHIAAKGGYLNIVHFLADNLAPIDMRNAKNETALLVASSQGQVNIVRLLIERGAGIGVRDIDGKSALDIATEKGYFAITQLLKDRTEGKILLRSNPRIDLHTADESNNFEHLQRTVIHGAPVGTEIENNKTDTAQVFDTVAQDPLDIHSYPRNALHTAAENGNLKEVQRLVKSGTAIDYGDSCGRTALWVAASRGHTSIIRLLLESGSCTNIPDCQGVTPVHVAAHECYWDAVEEFLIYQPLIGPEAANYLAEQLHRASKTGDLKVVLIILKCGISADARKNRGHTPLHLATNFGDLEELGDLLKHGAHIDTTENNGVTPLTAAARYGHVEVVRELLKHGAHIDTIENNGVTPLTAAARYGHVEVVRELLKHGAHIDTIENNGVTSLTAAARYGHVEVVLELLKHGAHIDTIENNGVKTLTAAARYGHVEVVRELLKHGACVDIETNNCHTPLTVAAQNGHVKVVRELIENGAGADIRENEGFTPLLAAAENGHLEVVRELLKHGASVDIATNEGVIPLKIAASKGHVDVFLELLNHGAGVNTADNLGVTPLYAAAWNGHVEVVRELLKHGVGVDIATNYGVTALMAAAQNGHVEVVRELLKNGAGVDIAENNSITALYVAAQNGHVEVVRELVKNGAGVDIAENDGVTALMAAAENGHMEVVRELLKNDAGVDIATNYGVTALYAAAQNGHVEVVREFVKNGAGVDIAAN